MLQAHSFLWHYLWIVPNILLIVLAAILWLRGYGRRFPVFIAFALVEAVGQLSVYAADVAPSVSAENFWRVDWASILTEGLLKFILIGEIFAQIFNPYASIAKVAKYLIRGVGVVLVLASAVAAAFVPKDNPNGLISGAHILEQTTYFIECGLLLFVFLLLYYFRLSASRPTFGIALGLAISSCVHLATWAVIDNAGLSNATRVEIGFLNMAVYHLCVIMWFYFLLVPEKVAEKPGGSLPPNNLELWNRELERLLHP